MALPVSGSESTAHRLRARPPFRLDLTVKVLRRLPTNRVDVLAPDGAYLRAFHAPGGVVTARVRQTGPAGVQVRLTGRGEHAPVLASIRRILGLTRELDAFERVSASIDWLHPLVVRMRGVKPPRYPTLWEAFVNSIVFQQVSLEAASTIVQRMVLELTEPVQLGDIELHPFPSVERVLGAEHRLLRGAGLSENKLTALQRAGEALTSGQLDERMIEERSSPEASDLLQKIRGVGPWTAAVILLRGFGRLDVFPMNDTGVARNLARLTGKSDIDIPELLEKLQPFQGMLYYQLLLARVEGDGDGGDGQDSGVKG